MKGQKGQKKAPKTKPKKKKEAAWIIIVISHY
jgi:hypothetical protein